jgi:hypothetical protein
VGFSFNSTFAIAIGSAAMLAGCGGTGASMPSIAQPAQSGATQMTFQQSLSSDKLGQAGTKTVIYIGNIDGQPAMGDVLVYPAGLQQHNPSLLRTILNGTVRPSGLWVDTAGTLYVANLPQGAPSIGVTEFHPGASQPFQTLTDQLSDPEQVAVAKDGTVYVNQRIGHEDFVTVFAPGSTHALATVDTHFGGYALQPGEMAFDRHGNLIISSETFKDGCHIFKLTPGSLTVTDLHLNVRVDGAGLAIDGAGNMYVSGFFNAPGIEVFAPGSKNPTRVIDNAATALTIKPDGTLYAMTETGVSEYAPGGSVPVNSFNAPPPVQGFGIALGPVR